MVSAIFINLYQKWIPDVTITHFSSSACGPSISLWALPDKAIMIAIRLEMDLVYVGVHHDWDPMRQEIDTGL
jgi:hypothetical protein